MKDIILTFNHTLKGVAGYDYGKEIYTEQVRDKINLDEGGTIVFPDHIQRIASSFIQGFFSDIVKDIGLEGIEKKLNFKGHNENIKLFVLDNLRIR